MTQTFAKHCTSEMEEGHGHNDNLLTEKAKILLERSYLDSSPVFCVSTGF